MLVSLGAFWDLYGREHICVGNCIKVETSLPNASQMPTNVKTTPTKGAKQQPKASVDPTLFSSCNTPGTLNKACKDCCDNLGQDVTVIQACKKSCNSIGQ